MKVALSIFYGFALAIVILIKGADIIMRLMEKRHVRRLRKARTYLAVRPSIDHLITERRAELESYAHWLHERITGPPGIFGKHAQAVSDQEIDDLIKDYVAFSKLIKKVLRKEHGIYKKLSDVDKAAWPTDEHAKWHTILCCVNKTKLDFKALRHNVSRNGIV